MSTASLPGTSDYREAVQNPHLFLADPELKRCKPALNKQGLPLVWSGGFAAVFQLQSPDGSKFAIKCFYRDIRNLETRYAEFDNHLRSRRPGYLVRFQYQPRGILVNGQWFPIVRMEWVEGQRLDEFLQHHLQRPGPQTRELLEAMAQLWHRLAGELERDRLAHGDLQHGNVLFIPGNRPNSVKLRLVDYDGVWVPALDTLPSNESGQPNYQHPQRRYGPLMDRFPHLVIYTTLRCLMLDQQLARHFSDQRLVFGQEDYAQPGRSELFRELWKNCRELNTRNLVGHLILACVQPFEQTPSLQELVPDAATGWVRPLTALQQGQVEEVLRNGSLSPQSSATSVSFASTGLGDRSVPNAAPPTGSASARPQRTAPTSLPPIPVPSGPTARPAAAPLPPTVLAPAPSPSAAPVPQADPLLATLGLVLKQTKAFLLIDLDPLLATLGLELLLMLYATAVGIVAGAMLAPLYAAVSVFVPFLLLALCLRWTGSKRWPRRLGGVGAVCAALALLVAHFHKWWWSLNCWWFGALVGLAVGGAVGLGNALAAVRAGLSHHLRSGLLHSLAWACAGSVGTVLALGWIPDQFALRPPSFADSWYEARRPTLTITRHQPEKGPIAGDPFTIEFQATSPVAREVHVEWRYAGEARWQRLAEPKLLIPEVKGDSLALEFRAVDSKGFAGSVVQGRWQVFVPTPTLKITKHDPPNGPIAGDPFTVEFEAASPVGRAVHVEWRYAGEAQWRRLSDPKLQIPEINGDALALEFRPVDSKGFVGTVVAQKIYVPVPALKITKQDPPKGPIAGDPFTVEFEATSPVGRAVHVDWRYAGAQWQRLAEPKLLIPQVKGDSLALEFRAVDSKGYSSGVVARQWNVSSVVRRFTGHEGAVSSVAVTPDGKYIVSGSWDNTVRVWELATGKEVRRFTGHESSVWSVAVTPDGKYVVSGSRDKTVRLWDLATGKEVRRLTGHDHVVWSVAVTPDGKYAVSGSRDKTVRLWDLATGKEVWRLTGHEWGVRSVAVTPDGKYVVSGSEDKTVRLWDVATGQEVRRFTGHEDDVTSVAVMPDGQYVVSGSGDGTVRLWDLATGQEVRRFTGHQWGVRSVAVTPDGQYVVSGSLDKTVRLWDLATGKEVRRFTGHEWGVTSVAVMPDGQYVVSGSDDKTVRLWELATGKGSAAVHGALGLRQ
jgi:DNA-binding beta-propeller fold protein YncE